MFDASCCLRQLFEVTEMKKLFSFFFFLFQVAELNHCLEELKGFDCATATDGASEFRFWPGR